MYKNYLKILLIIGLELILVSCIPDRMPTAPTEIERPVFVQFEIGSSNIDVPLNNQIRIYFNEAMDLGSFPDNFKVEGVSGEIEGTFSYGTADTIVVFTPSGDYKPAEYYEITLTGGVRDIHGNSEASPIEEDVPQQGWFFTSGEYSANGFPYIFVRDKSNKNAIYRAGDLNTYKDETTLPGAIDYQVSPMEVEKNTDNLFVVNLKTTTGLVTVINPSTFSIVKEIPVGLGPTNIDFSSQKAFVTNLSEKSFSVIDINSLTTETTYLFPDGFRPKDISYSNMQNALYFYSSVNSDIKKVNINDFNDAKIFPSGLTTRPTDIEITSDGRYLYMIGTNSNVLSIIDLTTEIPELINLEYQYLVDGVMGTDYYYLAYFRGTGGNNVGGILKIDIHSKAIVNKLEWEYQVDQIKLTAAEELLYAVTPADSTVQVIETGTMNKISDFKIDGSLKYLAITNNNY